MARISKSELVDLEQRWLDDAWDRIRVVNNLLAKRESVLRFEIVRHDLTEAGDDRAQRADG